MNIFVYWDEHAPMVISKAAELGQVTAVVIGENCPACTGADRILWCKAAGSAWIKGELLTQILRREEPDIVLFSAAGEAPQIAARAAVSLETGLCADCTELRMEDGQFVMHRPAFGGGVEADILCPHHWPQMATVRPGVFPVKLRETAPILEEFPLEAVPADPIEQLSRLLLPASRNLHQADILVAGGAGIGSREGFALLQKLADALGGQVAASRAAVDAGWASWDQQVGQTGQTVHPKLYLALGISGAIQHIAGMHTASTVISVNTDPKAPIFGYSDYAIVADWRDVVTRLLDALASNS